MINSYGLLFSFLGGNGSPETSGSKSWSGRSKVPVNGPVLKSKTLHQSVLKYLVSFNMVTHVVCFRITVAMITKY